MAAAAAAVATLRWRLGTVVAFAAAAWGQRQCSGGGVGGMAPAPRRWWRWRQHYGSVAAAAAWRQRCGGVSEPPPGGGSGTPAAVWRWRRQRLWRWQLAVAVAWRNAVTLLTRVKKDFSVRSVTPQQLLTNGRGITPPPADQLQNKHHYHLTLLFKGIIRPLYPLISFGTAVYQQ